LTISGFNASLGNKSFQDKKDRKDRYNRPVGYKNGLKLNEDLVNVDKWTVEEIDCRTEKLAKEVVKLFQIRGESE
jgi:hypothetical protein